MRGALLTLLRVLALVEVGVQANPSGEQPLAERAESQLADSFGLLHPDLRDDLEEEQRVVGAQLTDGRLGGNELCHFAEGVIVVRLDELRHVRKLVHFLLRAAAHAARDRIADGGVERARGGPLLFLEPFLLHCVLK